MLTGRDVQDFLRIAEHDERAARAILSLTRNVDKLAPARPGQSAAVSLLYPKTAALLFDRVWGGLDAKIPSSIAFWAGSLAEAKTLALMGKHLRDIQDESFWQQSPERPLTVRFEPPTDNTNPARSDFFTRHIAEDATISQNVAVVPLYWSDEDLEREYQHGDRSAIVATIRHLELISESDLTWDHVFEVRRDVDVVRKLRRLMHWLDSTMIGRNVSFVEDEIAGRLEDYETALRAHGLKSAIGTVSATLDSKVLLGAPAVIASLNYLGARSWSLLAGLAIVVGKVAVQIAEHELNYREIKDRSEIAFLMNLKQT